MSGCGWGSENQGASRHMDRTGLRRTSGLWKVDEGHPCQTMAKDWDAFCPFPETLWEVELKDSWQLHLCCPLTTKTALGLWYNGYWILATITVRIRNSKEPSRKSWKVCYLTRKGARIRLYPGRVWLKSQALSVGQWKRWIPGRHLGMGSAHSHQKPINKETYLKYFSGQRFRRRAPGWVLRELYFQVRQQGIQKFTETVSILLSVRCWFWRFACRMQRITEASTKSSKKSLGAQTEYDRFRVPVGSLWKSNVWH